MGPPWIYRSTWGGKVRFNNARHVGLVTTGKGLPLDSGIGELAKRYELAMSKIGNEMSWRSTNVAVLERFGRRIGDDSNPVLLADLDVATASSTHCTERFHDEGTIAMESGRVVAEETGSQPNYLWLRFYKMG